MQVVSFDGSAADVAGFEIDTTDAGGFLHRHVAFQVNDGDGQPTVQTADAGFYVWSLEMAVGALKADPIFFVHALGVEDEAAHEAAVAFVEANVVPEPTAALALAGVGGVLLRRRRRAAA